jgi:hypothetical protein
VACEVSVVTFHGQKSIPVPKRADTHDNERRPDAGGFDCDAHPSTRSMVGRGFAIGYRQAGVKAELSIASAVGADSPGRRLSVARVVVVMQRLGEVLLLRHCNKPMLAPDLGL